MNASKVFRLLGLCAGAGKIAPGSSAVTEALLRGKAKLVIIATDCGENTKSKIENLCRQKSVEFFCYSDKESLGAATGRDEKAVMAITDGNFAEAIKKELLTETAEK